MKESLKSGITFGTTSGIITTLGLIVGLNAGTHSILAITGGILAIAISDGLSESTGMHISKKTESKHSIYVWESTFATLIAKFIVTISFAIPVILINLSTAIIVDIMWGLLLLAILTFFTTERKNKWKDIAEHLSIAIFVILIAHYAGEWIHAVFS